MPKWLKWVLQVTAIALTTIVPISYILIKYGITDTEVREIKVGGLNIFWITFIAILCGSLAFWVINGVLVKTREKIKKHPFGSESRLLQQTVLLIIFISGVAMLNYTINFIISNTDGFLLILRTYRNDFSYLIGFVGTGFLIDRIVSIFNK